MTRPPRYLVTWKQGDEHHAEYFERVTCREWASMILGKWGNCAVFNSYAEVALDDI